MSGPEAKRYLESFERGSFETKTIGPWAELSKIRVINAETLVVEGTKNGRPVRLSYPLATVQVKTVTSFHFELVVVNDDLKLVAGRKETDEGIRNSQQIAEAIFSLQQWRVSRGSQDEHFDRVAREYAGAPRRPIPEAIRRLQIQAETKIEAKQFASAADLFEEALEIAPWWSDGYYNRALVLAELKRYNDAIADMRRFLRLNPQVTEARKLQDLIYQWEAMRR